MMDRRDLLKLLGSVPVSMWPTVFSLPAGDDGPHPSDVFGGGGLDPWMEDQFRAAARHIPDVPGYNPDKAQIFCVDESGNLRLEDLDG